MWEVFFVGVIGIGDEWFCIFGYLLVGISWRFGEFLFVFEEVFKELVGLFGRVFGLDDFEVRGDGVWVFV